MKPNIRLILQEAIERGVDQGYKYAFKHTDSPIEASILRSIEDAVWLEIDAYFDFEHSD